MAGDKLGASTKHINYEIVEELAELGLTIDEIAYRMDMAPATLYRKLKEAPEAERQDFYDRVKLGRARAMDKISRKLMEIAMSGDGKAVAACIWLSKVIGGRSDRQSVQVSTEGQEVEFTLKIGDKVDTGEDDDSKDA